MQWWVWVIIWSFLLLATLGVFAFLFVRLLKSVLGMGHEATKLLEQVDALAQNHEEIDAQTQELAVLTPFSKNYSRFLDEQKKRSQRRQKRIEKRILRAKMLIAADPYPIFDRIRKDKHNG